MIDLEVPKGFSPRTEFFHCRADHGHSSSRSWCSERSSRFFPRTKFNSAYYGAEGRAVGGSADAAWIRTCGYYHESPAAAPAEKIVDNPVPGRRGGGGIGGLQGFRPGQNSTVWFVEQNVDIPVPAGGLHDLPVRGASSSSAVSKRRRSRSPRRSLTTTSSMWSSDGCWWAVRQQCCWWLAAADGVPDWPYSLAHRPWTRVSWSRLGTSSVALWTMYEMACFFMSPGGYAPVTMPLQVPAVRSDDSGCASPSVH